MARRPRGARHRPDGALLGVCAGKDFASRRDTAMVRMFLDTGARLSEIAHLAVTDVTLGRDANLAHVVGKGRRPRDLPFGSKSAQALDRYLRVRARHSQAGLPGVGVARLVAGREMVGS